MVNTLYPILVLETIMPKVITQKEAEDKFKAAGMQLISPYVNCVTRVDAICYCGTHFRAFPASIFQKVTKSCGCLLKHGNVFHINKKKGKRYGKLTVLNRTQSNPLAYDCLCDCGNIVSKRLNKLLKSCGCLKNPAYEEISGNYWYTVRHGAKTRNLQFDITMEQCWNMFLQQDRKCAISGLILQFARKKEHSKTQTASLDRIDSSKGYTLDNVQWIHKDINKMKMTLTDEKLIKLCHIVSEYQNSLKEENRCEDSVGYKHYFPNI